MRKSEFATTAPGELVSIPGGIAFLPNGLPVQLDLSLDIWRAFDKARGALGEFLGQSRRVPNPALVTLPLLTMEAVESNRIEGTHTHVAEVLRQRAAGPPPDKEAASRNLEVLLYRDALTRGEEWLATGRPITEAFVRALHNELLSTGRGRGKSPGAYRRELVLIGNRADTPETARFVPPPHEHIDRLMADLVSFLTTEPDYPGLIACAVAHYQFETIHPFEDGNGRIGRLLIPLYLLARGDIDRPILYLSVYFEAHRDEYYERLKRVSTHGDWNQWILFFLEAVHARAEDSRNRVARILDLREQFIETVRANTKSQAALSAIDLVMSDIYVTAPEVQQYGKCSYNAARTAIGALESLGILLRVERLYPATWGAPALLDQIYF